MTNIWYLHWWHVTFKYDASAALTRASDDVEHSFLACSLPLGTTGAEAVAASCQMKSSTLQFVSSVCPPSVKWSWTWNRMGTAADAMCQQPHCQWYCGCKYSVLAAAFPPFFLLVFWEAWQECFGEVSHCCQLSGLVSLLSHRWLGMVDQWTQTWSSFIHISFFEMTKPHWWLL